MNRRRRVESFARNFKRDFEIAVGADFDKHFGRHLEKTFDGFFKKRF